MRIERRVVTYGQPMNIWWAHQSSSGGADSSVPQTQGELPPGADRKPVRRLSPFGIQRTGAARNPVPGRVSLVDEESIEQSHDIYLRCTGARGTSFSLYWLQAKSLFHVTMNEKFRKVRTAKLCPSTPDNPLEKIRIAGFHPIPIAPQ